MIYKLIRLFLFLLDPEKAHGLTLNLLKLAKKLNILKKPVFSASLSQTVMGLHFSNPVGIAAGLDKNAEYLDALSLLGFGFIEVGTVTPRPQPGNPKTRMFRYRKQQAIVNRMGFNNLGIENLLKNIKKQNYQGILGISISQNNHTPFNHAIDEYILCLQKVYPYADYVAVNVSCPNVKLEERLDEGKNFNLLLSALKAEQALLQTIHQKYVPIVIKISPDHTPEILEQIAYSILEFEIDAVIVTNTTSQRPCEEKWGKFEEKGGLSGKPLFNLSLNIVKLLHKILGEKVPIIACGGIMSGEDAAEMIKAGAKLIQVYTGLIYKGPELLKEILAVFPQE